MSMEAILSTTKQTGFSSSYNPCATTLCHQTELLLGKFAKSGVVV